METKKNIQKEEFKEVLSPKEQKNYVYPVKDWKDYLGESFLIIFSVLFALFLTEYVNKLHEKENTRDLIKSIVAELKHNKQAILEMKEYNLQVLNRIDSALVNRKLQDNLVSNDEFHLQIIAPQGILYRYLDNEAWTIAKNNNIMSKISEEAVLILSKLYEDQDRIGKVEEEIAKVIFDRASRDPKQVHTTLVLIRDNYHGWAVDRVPALVSRIDNAILKMEALTN
jgi:hypothetical protein